MVKSKATGRRWDDGERKDQAYFRLLQKRSETIGVTTAVLFAMAESEMR